MRRIISILLENEAGALSRVVGLFSQRNFNIETLTVAPTHDPTLSRLTLTTTGDDKVIEQITKHLNKLIDVIHAKDHTGEIVVEKELALMKVNCPAEKRTEILQIAEHFKSQTVDLSESTLMLQVTGSTEKLDAMELTVLLPVAWVDQSYL